MSNKHFAQLGSRSDDKVDDKQSKNSATSPYVLSTSSILSGIMLVEKESENHPEIDHDVSLTTIETGSNKNSSPGTDANAKEGSHVFTPMKKQSRLLFEDPVSNQYWSGMYNSSELWTCLYCGEKFLIKALLKSHASEHKDEKNYSVSQICQDCGVFFPTFDEYSNHMKQTGHMPDNNYGRSSNRSSVNSSSKSLNHSTSMPQGSYGIPPSSPLSQYYLQQQSSPQNAMSERNIISATTTMDTFKSSSSSSDYSPYLPNPLKFMPSPRGIRPLPSTLYVGGHISNIDTLQSSCAWVITDENDVQLIHGSQPIQLSSSFPSVIRLEYEATILGLNACLNATIRCIKIRSSSELFIRHLSYCTSNTHLSPHNTLSNLNSITPDILRVFDSILPHISDYNMTVVKMLSKFDFFEFELVSPDRMLMIQHLTKMEMLHSMQHTSQNERMLSHSPMNDINSTMNTNRNTGMNLLAGGGGGSIYDRYDRYKGSYSSNTSGNSNTNNINPQYINTSIHPNMIHYSMSKDDSDTAPSTPFTPSPYTSHSTPSTSTSAYMTPFSPNANIRGKNTSSLTNTIPTYMQQHSLSVSSPSSSLQGSLYQAQQQQQQQQQQPGGVYMSSSSSSSSSKQQQQQQQQQAQQLQQSQQAGRILSRSSNDYPDDFERYYYSR